jgi:hypothetical protein
MHPSVLNKETAETLETVSAQEFIRSFCLAGGTACAIYIGHRISEDLDFFSQEEFSQFEIQNTLRSCGLFLVDYSDKHTITGRLFQTKISFFHYDYPLIAEKENFLNVKLASLKDIGCMKLDAISSRGSRRDFVDLYFILKAFNMNLKEFYGFFQEKYGEGNFNHIHLLKSLIYFEDADKDPELNMLVHYSWEEVKDFFFNQLKGFKSF